jgi:hypothetical protein
MPAGARLADALSARIVRATSPVLPAPIEFEDNNPLGDRLISFAGITFVMDHLFPCCKHFNI